MATAVIGALRVMLSMDSAEFSAGVRRAQSDLDRVARNMQRTGAIMSAAITAPLVLFGRMAVNAAVDAEELQSAFDYTFGGMAGSMNEWARTTGDALGRSTQSMQQMAFTLGQLFNAAAPTREAAAALSQEFSQLALDLSSFFNVTEMDALEKLRAGLVGEAEPLRAFGVFMSDAAMRAKALELGLGDVNGVLTEQEKIMARAAVIMEQTAAAQGDLVRTSDSAANRQRALQAEFQELSVTVGQILLPVVSDLVGILTNVVSWFQSLDPEVQKAITWAAALAAAIGPVLLAFSALIRAVGLFLVVVPRVILAARAIALAMGSLGGPAGIALAVAAFAAVEIAIANTFQGGAEDAAAGVGAIIGDINALNAALGTVTDGPLDITVGLPPGFENDPTKPNNWGNLGPTPKPTATKRYDEEMVALSDHLASRLEMLRQSLMTEDELQSATHAARLAEVQEYLDAGLVDAQEAASLREQIEQHHQDTLTEITRQAEEERKQLRQQAVGNIASIFGSLSQIVGEEGEKQLKISKALAITEAGINTALGITKALSASPPPFNFIAAAAVGVAGAAQIAAIARSQKGSASVAPVRGAPSSGGGSSGDQQFGGGNASQGQAVTIHLQGGPSYNEQAIRDLVDQINAAQANGPKIKMYPQ